MWSPVRAVSGLAIVLSLANACSGTPPRQTSEAPAPAVAPPVEARLLPPFQGLVVFDVNQPAYVAVFDVRPYIGLEMIYPGPNDPGRATGGVQAVPIYYLPQASEERQAQATPLVGGGQDYLFLVASRTPLHLDEFAVHPIALSESAGVSLRALPPNDQIDSLMRNVVRPQYDRDWDADVLILTPGGGSVGTEQLALDCGIAGAPDTKICAHQSRLVPTASIDAAAAAQSRPATVMTADKLVAANEAAGNRYGVGAKSGVGEAAKAKSGAMAHASMETAVSSVASKGSTGGATAAGGGGKP